MEGGGNGSDGDAERWREGKSTEVALRPVKVLSK